MYLQISPNGYVVLGQRYSRFTPRLFPVEQSRVKIIAPFWTDSATSANDTASEILYRVYSRGVNMAQNNTMLARVENDIRRYVKQPRFICRWAIVVEWRNVRPYPAEDNPNEVCFYSLTSSHLYVCESVNSIYIGLYI